MEFTTIFFRTLMLYAIIILIFRLMGKREIGELSILDLVIFMMIAEMAVIAIENTEMPFIDAVLPMFVLTVTQISLAFISLKNQKFRRFIDGEPVIIINKGKIDERAMRKLRYNFDDLLVQLREEQIGDIRDVEYAILETTGKLTVFSKKGDSKLAIPLIIDGEIQEKSLKKANKTYIWLKEKLIEQGYQDINRISFCSIRDNELYIDLYDKE
jgi:uncharacterized membrane protein YcaP (DUF421 family)